MKRTDYPYTNEQITELQRILLKEEEILNLNLKKIIKSLKKIESGEYGICDGCQDKILFRKLNSYPTMNMCIVCKEEKEMEEEHNYLGRRQYAMMDDEERKQFSPIVI